MSTRTVLTPTAAQTKKSFRAEYICVFVCYIAFILASALIFALLENICYVDALYFTVVTQSTVGYGDITPQTNYGLIFNFFFIIISFGVIVILFNFLFDYWFDRKIDELCAEINTEIQTIKLWGKQETTVEFKTEEEKTSSQNKLYLFIYISIYILWIIIWIMFFCLNPHENFTVFEALYFAIVTSTTVGYGNYLPQSNGAKLFIFFFVNLGVMALAVLLSALSDIIVNLVRKFEPNAITYAVEERKESQKEKLTALLSEYEVMTKHHYIVHRLLNTNRISNEEYEEFEKEFIHLDKDNSGKLDKEDLKYFRSVDSEQNDNQYENSKLLVDK